jgi:hypothetical protein
MKFEDLLKEWEKDSDIDKTELDHESIKIPKLHHKYYTMLVTEKSILQKLTSTMKRMKLSKFEFFSQGHNEETKKLNWQFPPKGIVLKADIPMYLDADIDIINLSLRIGIQQEKIEFLESVIKSFQYRGFLIKNAVDFIKFKMGG